MDESVKVWVRTPLISAILHGKSVQVGSRALPDSDPSGDDEKINWGWARGGIVSDGKEDIFEAKNPVKVFIQDEESEFDRETIQIPPDKVKDGIVMANIYGDGNEEEEEDYDDYGYDDGYGGGEDNFEASGGKESIYPNDLITLTHLHEPAVVYCLRKRYGLDKIYTSTGPILLALNPFKNCRSLYSDKIMTEYWKRGEAKMQGLGEEKKDDSGIGEPTELPPHVYAIADNSFRSMMTKLEEMRGGARSRDGKGADQSILVSGESGAGKTVTTKFIMKYLANLSQRSATSMASRRNLMAQGDNSKGGIESQVLGSNPILEAWGNARTIRNDNSSRFGKFIEIQFTKDGALVGANIETYLLEKVRLITQAPGERNYHIFYMVMAGFSDEQMDNYFLGDFVIDDFKMCNSSGTFDRRDGVDDYDTYQETVEAMDTMGFSDDDVDSVLRITCACLHSSNLTFLAVSADESQIDPDNPHLEAICSLLGVTHKALESALCTFTIKAGRESHVRSLNKEKAEKGIEGMIKATYGALFNYIVKHVNARITVPTSSGKARGPSKASSIGVLDIFGFESFKHNSFEQLCINYCNEALQQQFNMFVLKNEQDEYEKEGIQWAFISFPDNGDVLDLIDKKNTGILSILDGHCKAPGGSDKTFSADIYKICKASSRFEATFRQVGANKFGVIHYAGPVEYDTSGFVQKNKDELPREATDLLLSSTYQIVKDLAKIISGEDEASAAAPAAAPGRRAPRRGAPGGKGGSSKRQTVGGQFSAQLQSLRKKIDLTSPHYVRCLKPNDLLVPDHFNPLIISDQLRCAGVIEAVRVSRVGYPQRYTHPLFVNRYRILGIKEMKAAQRSSRRQRPVDVLVQAIGRQILEMDNPELKKKAEEAAKAARASAKKGRRPPAASAGPKVDLIQVGIQVGKTKVFLRRVAYDKLERLRQLKMAEGAIKLQTLARGYVARNNYKKFRWAVIKLQCCLRASIAGAELQALRECRAATMMAKYYRRFVAERHMRAVCVITKALQRFHRGIMGRKRYVALNRVRKSIVIEKYWRRYAAQSLWKKQRVGVPTIQRAMRCYWARGALRELKAQSRNLAAIGEERDSLKLEVQKLKRDLDKAKKDLKAEKEVASNAIKEAKKAAAGDPKKMAEMTKQIGDANKECEAVKKEMEKESARANAAEERVKEEKAKIIAATEKSHKEEARATKAEEELEKEVTRASAAEKAVKEAKEKADAYQKECTDLKSLLAEAEGFKTIAEEKDQEIKEMEDEIERYKQDMEELEDELKNAKNSAPSIASPETTTLVDSAQVDSLNETIEKLRLELQEQKQAASLMTARVEEENLRATRAEVKLKAAQELADARGPPDTTAKAPAPVRLPKEGSLVPEGMIIVDEEDYEELQANCDSLTNQLKEAREDLEDAELELKRTKENMTSSSRGAPTPQSASNVDMEEMEEAKLEIRFLKKQLAEIQRNAPDPEEMAELKCQVANLERDLEQARVNNSNGMGSVTPIEDNATVERRYSELRRMANTLMEKDNELNALRNEISRLNTMGPQQRADSGLTNDDGISVNSPISIEEDTPRSQILNFRSKITRAVGFGGGSQGGSNRQNKEELLSVEDASAMRAVNEMLRNELETTRQELNDAKEKLKEEVERGQKDLEAFAEALHGVDELRRSAEMMSRQLKQMKQQKKQRRMKNSQRVNMDGFDYGGGGGGGGVTGGGK
mmetsp:Transcript_31216/g.38122  ORF Transcript_31216/g.38122 Transcript_31216/m.38122 type:complete len:1710 (+) Transcript_31216:294-5423(+)